MSSYLLYVAECQCQGVMVKGTIHEIPFCNINSAGRTIRQDKLNPWIIEGNNPLKVMIGLSPDARPDLEPEFRFRLLKGVHGQEPGEDGVLIDYEWEMESTPVQTGQLTTVHEEEVSIDQAFGQWAWENAPQTPLSAADRQEFISLVQQMHSALEQKDIQLIDALTELKIKENALALDVPEPELKAAQSAFFSDLLNSVDVSVAPLDTAGLIFNEYSNNRVVEVTDEAGKPPLGATADGQKFAMEVFVTRSAGSWKIIR